MREQRRMDGMMKQKMTRTPTMKKFSTTCSTNYFLVNVKAFPLLSAVFLLLFVLHHNYIERKSGKTLKYAIKCIGFCLKSVNQLTTLRSSDLITVTLLYTLFLMLWTMQSWLYAVVVLDEAMQGCSPSLLHIIARTCCLHESQLHTYYSTQDIHLVIRTFKNKHLYTPQAWMLRVTKQRDPQEVDGFLLCIEHFVFNMNTVLLLC